jgi:hypothetical protein
MKPEPKDIKVFLKFTPDELDLLQDNAYQMADSFGLDRRIDNLKGVKKVGFYSWDLECLEAVVGNLKERQDLDIAMVNELYNKIEQAIEYIDKNS